MKKRRRKGGGRKKAQPGGGKMEEGMGIVSDRENSTSIRSIISVSMRE
jgi:hypothetical protein